MEQISVGNIFRKARETSKAHFNLAWKTIAVEAVAKILLYGFYAIILLACRGAFDGQSGESSEKRRFRLGLGIAMWIAAMIASIVSFIVTLGRIYISVRLARGQLARWTDIFRYFKRRKEAIRFYVYESCVGIIVLVGLFLLIIPGIYAAVAFTVYLPLLIVAEGREPRLHLLEALKKSNDAIKPKWFTFFAWHLMKVLLSISCILILPIIRVAPILLAASGVEWALLFGQYHSTEDHSDEEARRKSETGNADSWKEEVM